MKRCKILIVEDEADLLDEFVRVLESEGHEILKASSGQEGLKLAEVEHPHLVLLDSLLPDMSSIEVCRKLKAGPEMETIFVVMVFGPQTSVERQAEALNSGADSYLNKPIEPQALKAQVLAFLRIQQNEAELRESERRYRAQAEELKEANRRLEEYNRLKAEFVANMSHELRTPLTSIIGFAQLVKLTPDAQPISPKYADAMERILRNGQHLLSLINDVLDISKIEAGRMKIHREHIDLAEVMHDAFSELQSLAQRKAIEYRLHIPERLPLAFNDPLRIRQIIINLLSNALKFTAQGKVEAELLPWGDKEFRIIVRDTGIGIDDQSLGIIFERFRQVDGSTSRAVGGVGLGLSIVKQIIYLLGGQVEVTSKINEGSTFTVTMPLIAPDTAARPSASLQPSGAVIPGHSEQPLAEANTAQTISQPLVLVIEDDIDTAALLTKTIESAGYRVGLATDGPTGLQMASQLDPEAIMLDIMMPGMDGWRVLQALKSDRRLAQIPVIVCSIVDNRPLGYSLGASDYLLKPVEPEELLKTLQNISTGKLETAEGYVLVVDDEHGVRELLVAALQHVGYQVRSATSGETAFKLISTIPPHAILCDLMMPGGMSGFELIARLRSNPNTAHIPVIVITGKDITPDDRQLISGQIANVIRKGELLMSDISLRLRETLEDIGVKPTDGQDTAH